MYTDQINPEETQDQISTDTLQEFGKEFAELLIKHKDTIPLAYMAKLCLSNAVDLLVNQSAIQTQYIVQQMLAPLFPQEPDHKGILIP